MNVLLIIGLMLIIGYTVGWLLDKIGLPRIIGYIVTGIAFSPGTSSAIDVLIIKNTQPLLDISLAFIAFEVGGALKWSKIKKHEKEIISITILASILPLIFIFCVILSIGLLFIDYLPFGLHPLIILALLLGALASPTEPAATLAVMHQYKARGKLTDTILGIAALDDVLGILLFSICLASIFMISGEREGMFGNPLLNGLSEAIVSISIGSILALLIDIIARILKIKGDGQWVVLIFSLIILCTGVAISLHLDMLLALMAMGMVVTNTCRHQAAIFRLLERYTEDLIFLFFFLLSGLHLNIGMLAHASIPIGIFVVFRILGKYLGAMFGAKAVHADAIIQKYTAGGLLPQGGIVIGLVLSIYHKPQFAEISDILLTTVMGATIINELFGPIAAKYSLRKSGEIKTPKSNAGR